MTKKIDIDDIAFILDTLTEDDSLKRIYDKAQSSGGITPSNYIEFSLGCINMNNAIWEEIKKKVK